MEKIRGAAASRRWPAGTSPASSLELSELGTAIFKETLNEGTASIVQVIYTLKCHGRIPESRAWATWDASEFYRFFQDIDTEDNFWSEDSYTEVQTSCRWKNDVTKSHFEFVGDPNLSDRGAVQDRGRRAGGHQPAARRRRRTQPPREVAKAVDPDVKGLREDQDIEDIRRTIRSTQIATVRVEWSEAKAIVTERSPQGMLPTVTSLTDANGQPLVWEDYYSKINVDEFLKTIQVTAQVNGDFDNLPIHSVEVKIRYPHGPNAKTQEFTFTDADHVAKFEAFVHNGIRKFIYSYRVNYHEQLRSSSSPLRSRPTTTT